MSAPNGARRQKTDHSEIPLSPEEMASCACEIRDAGATILHLHVRDENGAHSLDVDRYQASIKAVRAAVRKALVIQATTEAVGIYNRHQQMEMVRALKPEAVSLAFRELCPDENAASEFSDFLKWLKSEKIFPQFILYNRDDYLRFEDFRKRGVFLNDNPFVLFVLGSYQGQTKQTVDDSILLMEDSMVADIPWAVCGFQDNEFECISHAAFENGHVRVGFENNIWKPEGSLLDNNAEMVAHAAGVAEKARRPVATADLVRSIFDVRE